MFHPFNLKRSLSIVKKSLMLVSLLLVLLWAFSGSALAQGPSNVICTGLDSEDCEILEMSAEAMQEVSSGTSEMSMDIFVGNIPDAPFSELAISIASSSAYSVDPEVTAELVELQTLGADEVMADMDEVMDLVLAYYGSANSATDITISLSEEVVAALEAGGGVAIPDVLPLSIVMVDGVLYLNVDELASQMPELAAVSGWFGVDIVEILALSMAATAANGNAVATPNMNGMALGMSMGAQANGGLAPFVSVEREEDYQVDDQLATVFHITFDWEGIMTSDTFANLVATQMTASGAGEAEIEENLAMLDSVAPMLAPGMDTQSWQVIGLDDYYVYQTQTAFEWDLSSVMPPAGNNATDAPLIQFETITDLANFNADIEISVPDNAVIIPTEVIMAAMSGQ
jgi:hypothetical protein